MANRAYLYSIDVVPDKDPEQKRAIKELSEFKWDIPLAFKLLVAHETKICQSILCDEEKIGLIGDY